ncbi:hypothetical protein N7456_011267 [Penicillium angulare]|uniref:Terpene synthase n=1 Tax=Penicillium angulare TaxID=116970 RepID=A0A9W9ETI0_9EURO|nr:hypothetical protein N7456_011267 [Penicillium angulare]
MQKSGSLAFRLPPPVNLISWREHPKAKEIKERSDSWSRRSLTSILPADAVETYLQTDASWWTCLSYPSADEEKLLLIHKLSQYLFLLDDIISYPDGPLHQSNSPREVFNGLKDVLRDRRSTEPPPSVLPFIELWDQMAPDMTPGVKERFIVSLEDILNGFEREAVIRARGQWDDEQYFEIRRQTAAITTCLVFIEYGRMIDLSDILATQPSLQKALDLAEEHLILYNEILSFRKEYFSGDKMGLVTMWAGEDLDKLQYAVDKIHGMAIKAERDFVDLRDNILATEWGKRDDVRAYLEEVGCLMVGTLHYQYISPRYHGIGHVWNGSTSGTLTLTPELTIFPPVNGQLVAS